MSDSVHVIVKNYLDPRKVSRVAAAAELPFLTCYMLAVQYNIGLISGQAACDAVGVPDSEAARLSWDEARELLVAAEQRVEGQARESISQARANLEAASAAEHAGLISEVCFQRC